MSKPRIVICTDFFGKYDTYSVSNVAFTEAEAFVKLGYEVAMIVRESYPQDGEVEGIEFLRVMPHPSKQHKMDPNFAEIGKEWKDWKDAATVARDRLQETLPGYDVAITHDWLLQNSCQPWNWAMRRVMVPGLTWYHRLHSYPTGDPYPENQLNEITELKCTLPGNGNHFIVWANNGHALWVAERYLTDLSKVKVVPLGVNWPEFLGMTKEAEMIVDAMDAFDAEIFQAYAFCSSRLNPKGVKYLIQLFGAFKRLGHRVKLILCNANSEDKGKERDSIQQMSDLAKENGLIEFEDFCFTSRLHNRFLAGIPRMAVRDLQSMGNVFIFPSETETYGLVALEAAVTGQLLVLNEDLVPLKEVGGNQSLYMRWDSDHKNIRTTINWHPSEREAMYQYARAILPEISTNRVLQNKMRVLNQHYSLNVARRHWEPLIYKYWSKPLVERGEDEEAKKVRKVIGGVMTGEVGRDKSDVLYEKLSGGFAPKLGLQVVQQAAVVEEKVEVVEESGEEKPQFFEIDLAALNQPRGVKEDAEVQRSDPDSQPAWPCEGS